MKLSDAIYFLESATNNQQVSIDFSKRLVIGRIYRSVVYFHWTEPAQSVSQFSTLTRPRWDCVFSADAADNSLVKSNFLEEYADE